MQYVSLFRLGKFLIFSLMSPLLHSTVLYMFLEGEGRQIVEKTKEEEEKTITLSSSPDSEVPKEKYFLPRKYVV